MYTKRKQFGEIVREMYMPKISRSKQEEFLSQQENIATDPFRMREERRLKLHQRQLMNSKEYFTHDERGRKLMETSSQK